MGSDPILLACGSDPGAVSIPCALSGSLIYGCAGPCKFCRLTSARSRPPSPPRDQGHMTPRSRERVLIVEDDSNTRLGLTELVRTWGFSTEAAADGQEALQRITAFRPSIVITDLVMPR